MILTLEEIKVFRKRLVESMEDETTCSDCYGTYLDAVGNLREIELKLRGHAQVDEIPEQVKLIFQYVKTLSPGPREKFRLGVMQFLPLVPEGQKQKVQALMDETFGPDLLSTPPGWVEEELKKMGVDSESALNELSKIFGSTDEDPAH